MAIITESALRNLIRQTLLQEGIYDPGVLKAVFLAGGPGSGKSYTAKGIFGVPRDLKLAAGTASGLRFINSDPAFERELKKMGIDPKTLGSMPAEEFEALTAPTDSPRARAKSQKKAMERLSIGGRLGMILDGTGDDYSKIARKKAQLEALGYDTYMIFINTSLDVAQERNAKRDRVLKRSLVDEIWHDVQQNMGAFQDLFGPNFRIVDNTDYAKSNAANVEKTVKTFMREPVSNPIGRKWIAGELEKKGPKARLPKNRPF